MDRSILKVEEKESMFEQLDWIEQFRDRESTQYSKIGPRFDQKGEIIERSIVGRKEWLISAQRSTKNTKSDAFEESKVKQARVEISAVSASEMPAENLSGGGPG